MRARFLLPAGAVLAFGGSLLAGFHVDDYAIFSEPLRDALRGPSPLTQLTLWLNYQVAGQMPLPYHAINLLLHVGAVMLAFACLRKILPERAAWIGAALFAIHPLQAEAVDYISARGVLLAGLLCFAALWTWLQGQVWGALALFVVALAADPRCAMFPAVLLLPLRPSRGSDRVAIGAMAVASIAAAVRAHPANYTMALTTVRFLRLFVVPWGFTADPYVHEPLWLAILAAILIVAGAVWLARKLPVDSPVAWFFAGLLLLIPNFSTNPAVDSRMYLPLFAFAAAAGLLLARIPGSTMTITLAVLLCAVSVSRTYVWASEERLWREAVRRAPDRAEPKVQLAKQLRASEALELLSHARVQAPYNPEIPADIGKILLDEGQYDGALDELSHAVALDPKNALAFNNRGVALAALGHPEAAAADLQHALALDPNLTEARENLKRLTGQ